MGKGSRIRPRVISQDQWEESWNRIFGTDQNSSCKSNPDQICSCSQKECRCESIKNDEDDDEAPTTRRGA